MKKRSKQVCGMGLMLSLVVGCGDSVPIIQPVMQSPASGYTDPYNTGTSTGTHQGYGTNYGTGYGTSPANSSGFGSSYGTGYPVTSQSATGKPVSPQSPANPTPNYLDPAQPNYMGSANPGFGPGTIGKPALVLVSPAAQTNSPLAAYRDTFFKNYGSNPFVEAGSDPLSTFALDVDTGSYTFGRNELQNGKLPPKDSVRTEEYLNAFNYQYPQPASGNFAIHTDLAPAYFAASETRLLRIGIQGRQVDEGQRKAAILTYAIDVSGSMNQPNRLELVKQSIRQMLPQLWPSDKIAIVVYGSDARVVLPHTAVSERSRIESVIDSLRPEGSTNVEAGLSLAYQEASKAFRSGLINRVILCSDGVANVGETGPEKMLGRIQKESENGINLTTLGFGMGEYNDTLMEQLADQGDGMYAYIDSLEAARQVLGKNLTGTLQTIAKDAKIQVSFNQNLVDQYRLLGYENRAVADKDFRNDQVDAGEIGAGHSVTALYEVRLKQAAPQGELAKITLRYKDVDHYQSIQELSHTVNLSEMQAFDNTQPSFKLASAVAEFAEILRQSVFARKNSLNQVRDLALTVQQEWPQDQTVRDFAALVQKAGQLQQPLSTQSVEVHPEANPNLPDWSSFVLRQLGGRGLQ